MSQRSDTNIVLKLSDVRSYSATLFACKMSGENQQEIEECGRQKLLILRGWQ